MQRRYMGRIRLFAAALATFAIISMGDYVFASSEAATTVDLSLFEETGERRMCLTYSRLTGFVPIDNRRFFFAEGGEYYLNKTLSGCRAANNPDMIIKFIIKTGKICRNTRVHVYKRTGTAPLGSCALGDFKKLQLKSDVDSSPQGQN